MTPKTHAPVGLLVAAGLSLLAQAAPAQSAYQKPPPDVLRVLHAPLPPEAFVDPAGDIMILATFVRYPPIAELARPFYRLAGARVDPQNHGLHGAIYWSDYTLAYVRNGTQARVTLPAGAKLGRPNWSSDGKRFAFTNIADDGVELWMGDSATARAQRIAYARLNVVLGDAVQWMPDQKTLLVKLVPDGQKPPPQEPSVPPGPDIQESSGGEGAMSTYEVRDVLKSPHDEDLFDYYATSQLALVDVASGTVTPIGKPAILAEVSPAPDGRHILVETIHRPYSRLTASIRFPREVEIWDAGGKVVHGVASLPLADSVPIRGVPTGPREFSWRATEPATLVWAEALDGGDWKTQVPQRDRVMMQGAPFDQPPVEITRTEQRFDRFWWGERRDLAFVAEHDLIKRRERIHSINVDDPKASKRLIWDRSMDEEYKHPGYPVLRVLPNGSKAVLQDGDFIYLTYLGASPDGDRPFLDKFNLTALTTERLFRSERNAYERFVAWSDLPAGEFITRHESPAEPPNFFVRTLGKPVAGAPAGEAAWTSTALQVTHYSDPAPEVRGITKRIVKYRRADGVDLNFTLYLPPGYKEGTRLPTVLWAYPLDYTDPQMAGQVQGSAQRFTILGWPLQLFFLLDGYAVIDNPSLPIIGDANRMYDTYMEQLVAGAKAAVDKAVELGVTDPDRIGATGHSHGALMTANLLAHSDLFRAGIARSGSYNKSLTAFGFQNERRTLWEATDVYLKVSPLFHADKIKEPLLLVHGEADVNPGTVPLQSEMLYEAIRGTGGTVRLVMLPFESHGYVAMETDEDLLSEMLTWFDRYVKHAPPRPKASDAAQAPKAPGAKAD